MLSQAAFFLLFISSLMAANWIDQHILSSASTTDAFVVVVVVVAVVFFFLCCVPHWGSCLIGAWWMKSDPPVNRYLFFSLAGNSIRVIAPLTGHLLLFTEYLHCTILSTAIFCEHRFRPVFICIWVSINLPANHLIAPGSLLIELLSVHSSGRLPVSNYPIFGWLTCRAKRRTNVVAIDIVL